MLRVRKALYSIRVAWRGISRYAGKSWGGGEMNTTCAMLFVM